MRNTNPALAKAYALDRQGRLPEAIAAYQNLLASEPRNSDALHLLGVAMARSGRGPEGARAIATAAELQPDNPSILTNLALALISLKRLPEALDSLDRALALGPRLAVVHAVRGNVLSDLGRMSEALESYDRALALQPNEAVTSRNRARVLMTLERLDEALAGFEAAIRLRDTDADSHFYRGLTLAKAGRPAEALASYERARQLQPGSAQILNNRAIVLAELDRPEEAATAFQAALEINPTHLEALENGANTARVLQRYDDALQLFDRALALEPDNPRLRLSKGLLLLTQGDFSQGWTLHAARLGAATTLPSIESLRDTTVLVHAEQGLGDTLQFCRYVPMLEARGVHVTFAVQPALQLLLRSLSASVQILPYDQPLPAHANRLALLSLPMLFDTRVDTIPAPVPYLSAPATGKQPLQSLPGLKVGIAWQGNVETEKQGGFRGRSIALAEFAPLTGIAGVTLISLQKGAGARQREEVPFREQVLELTDPDYLGPQEMLETAALIQELDLVVTSDTVTAHLAGALGVPVWVALSTSSDWRWLTQREDTPWYPNMRLFRQSTRGQWAPVFQRMAQELNQYRGEPRNDRGRPG